MLPLDLLRRAGRTTTSVVPRYGLGSLADADDAFAPTVAPVAARTLDAVPMDLPPATFEPHVPPPLPVGPPPALASGLGLNLPEAVDPLTRARAQATTLYGAGPARNPLAQGVLNLFGGRNQRDAEHAQGLGKAARSIFESDRQAAQAAQKHELDVIGEQRQQAGERRQQIGEVRAWLKEVAPTLGPTARIQALAEIMGGLGMTLPEGLRQGLEAQIAVDQQGAADTMERYFSGAMSLYEQGLVGERAKTLAEAGRAQASATKEATPDFGVEARRLIGGRFGPAAATNPTQAQLDWANARMRELGIELRREEGMAAAGAQPVPAEQQRLIIGTQQALKAGEQMVKMLLDPDVFDKIEPFIGPPLTGARLRETIARKGPEWLRTLTDLEAPRELIGLGQFEATARNIILAARSGQAISEGEARRMLEEIPSRADDLPEHYKQKAQATLANLRDLEALTRSLSVPGGRSAIPTPGGRHPGTPDDPLGILD